MRRLTIAVDANKATCGRCEYALNRWCHLFGALLGSRVSRGQYVYERLPACLAAEAATEADR